jgi:glycogen synthase
MKQIQNVLVTGEKIFLERHQFLFQALNKNFDNLDFLPRESLWYESELPRIFIKGYLKLRTGSLSKTNAIFQKNKLAFIAKSKSTEKKIKQLKYTPDLVFHVFGTYSPFWNNFDIPYVIYLDYTTALAEKNWPSWAYFMNSCARNAWFDCESIYFHKATHIFTMSNIVKNSLINYYNIPSNKITVVGSSGDFLEPLSTTKTFGSKQILFNGSDFERKGGDLVIAAFKLVKKVIPEAKLVLIGKKTSLQIDGITNPGHISRTEIHDLFANTDLVLAPAYCDPFPTFLMEAMNYGIPCIVSANDGMPEIIDHQENGLVIKHPTPDILANYIVNLLSEPCQLLSLSQAARQKVKEKLNWNNVAKQIVNILS